MLSLVQKKIALIISGKFQALRELWSGRAGGMGREGYEPQLLPSTYSPDPTDKHLSFPRAERRFHLGTAKTVTRGYEEGSGVEFYGLPPSLSPSLCISLMQLPKGEMKTAAASVNEIITAVGIAEFTFSQMA